MPEQTSMNPGTQGLSCPVHLEGKSYKYAYEVGHEGTIKTMIVVQEGYVWPGMKSEIDSFIKTCPTCRVHSQRPDKVPTGDMPLVNSPGQIIGVDLIGPMIPSHKDNKHIMVIIDPFSGWVEAYPLATKSNEAEWEKLRSDNFPRHGACQVMLTDQGAEKVKRMGRMDEGKPDRT